MALSPFDFTNSINNKDKYLIDGPDEESQYNAFMVNRSLSYFPDTVVLANTMNQLHHLDEKMQYDFLYHTVRKRKRFSKWAKADKLETVELLKEYYGYSSDKASSVVDMVTDEHKEHMKRKLSKGGKKR